MGDCLQSVQSLGVIPGRSRSQCSSQTVEDREGDYVGPQSSLYAYN